MIGYIQLRYVRASVKPKLNSTTYPSKAPVPIQYQYACGKNPRDFRTVTPSVSLEFGTACNTINVSVTSKTLYQNLDRGMDTYSTPAVSEELVGHNSVLSVHDW